MEAQGHDGLLYYWTRQEQRGGHNSGLNLAIDIDDDDEGEVGPHALDYQMPY
ncbi:hypothetical protein SAY87_027196 [Trapa incisa]|uniref:Uncharacterized protein n=1 Tax=Trapa incisa TaxID=236973 RepID=A0AAN7GYU5_9MYRT|nr:hypothetical protein SAY87_027196 [Trapa incisa]